MEAAIAHYFAYGSNMHAGRLRRRVAGSEPLGPAVLTGYRLRFHKRGRDGSGKCNVVATDDPGDAVHGRLFRVPAAGLDALDRCEGRGYLRERLTVEHAGGATQAVLYVARPDWIDEALAPFDWYHRYVLEGAREAGLPAAYRAAIAAVAARPDPLRLRAVVHRRVLAG